MRARVGQSTNLETDAANEDVCLNVSEVSIVSVGLPFLHLELGVPVKLGKHGRHTQIKEAEAVRPAVNGHVSVLHSGGSAGPDVENAAGIDAVDGDEDARDFGDGREGNAVDVFGKVVYERGQIPLAAGFADRGSLSGASQG